MGRKRRKGKTEKKNREKPCEVKVSCTVLKSSLGGDPYSDFNPYPL